MAMTKDERFQAAFAPHLHEGETLLYPAYGVKQPKFWLIVLLIFCAILPGIIAIALLTKNYLIGLTEGRLLILEVKGMKLNKVKSVIEYPLTELESDKVKTSTGGLFTHIEITDPDKPFKAKFHRAFSKNNRPNAMAIAEAISA